MWDYLFWHRSPLTISILFVDNNSCPSNWITIEEERAHK